MGSREQILELRERMQRSIIGQRNVVERLILGLLADGHLLVEGLPGLAKTRARKRNGTSSDRRWRSRARNACPGERR